LGKGGLVVLLRDDRERVDALAGLGVCGADGSAHLYGQAFVLHEPFVGHLANRLVIHEADFQGLVGVHYASQSF